MLCNHFTKGGDAARNPRVHRRMTTPFPLVTNPSRCNRDSRPKTRANAPKYMLKVAGMT